MLLFTNDPCLPCKRVKQFLTQNGIVYEEKNVMDHLEEAVSLGVKSAPSVVIDGQIYAGYDAIVSKLVEI